MNLSINHTDISRFFIRKGYLNRLQIPHCVTLVIGPDTLQCSGLILANSSSVLLDMMVKGRTCGSCELYLDEFTGVTGAVEDCIDLLYGGTVDVDIGSIQAMLKFGKLFQIDELVETCLTFIEMNIKNDNFGLIIKVGLFVNGLQEPDRRILELCKKHLDKVVLSGEVLNVGEMLGLTGDLKEDSETISFLLSCEGTLLFTLPTITAWTDNSAKAELVLNTVEEAELWNCFSSSKEMMEMVQRLNDTIESLNAAKILNKLQSFIILNQSKKVVTPMQPEQPEDATSPRLHAEESKPWILAEQLIAEMKNSSFEKVQEAWSSIDPTLGYQYLNILKNTVEGSTGYTVPAVVRRTGWHEWCSREAEGRRIRSTLLDIRRATCDHGSIYLVDDLPCYYIIDCNCANCANCANCLEGESHEHAHWYLTTLKHGKRVLLSLVTNTREEVLGVLRSLADTNGTLKLHTLQRQYHPYADNEI